MEKEVSFRAERVEVGVIRGTSLRGTQVQRSGLENYNALSFKLFSEHDIVQIAGREEIEHA